MSFSSDMTLIYIYIYILFVGKGGRFVVGRTPGLAMVLEDSW